MPNTALKKKRWFCGTVSLLCEKSTVSTFDFDLSLRVPELQADAAIPVLFHPFFFLIILILFQ